MLVCRHSHMWLFVQGFWQCVEIMSICRHRHETFQLCCAHSFGESDPVTQTRSQSDKHTHSLWGSRNNLCSQPKRMPHAAFHSAGIHSDEQEKNRHLKDQTVKRIKQIYSLARAKTSRLLADVTVIRPNKPWTSDVKVSSVPLNDVLSLHILHKQRECVLKCQVLCEWFWCTG